MEGRARWQGKVQRQASVARRHSGANQLESRTTPFYAKAGMQRCAHQNAENHPQLLKKPGEARGRFRGPRVWFEIIQYAMLMIFQLLIHGEQLNHITTGFI